MNRINLILSVAYKPFLILLLVGTLSAVALPGLWLVTGKTVLAEKLFQKTALLLLFIAALIFGKPFSGSGSRQSRRNFSCLSLIAFCKGWLTGLITLIPPIMLLLFLNVRIIDQSISFTFALITKKLMSALITGVAVGLIEEVIFRGWLLDWLRKQLKSLNTFGTWLAMLLSSLYFALLHFLKPDTSTSLANNSQSVGFLLFINSFVALLLHTDIWTLLALFMAGLFLAVIKASANKQLVTVIGIHASWVFCIKTTKTFTDINLHSDWQWLVSIDGINGILTALWLVLILLIIKPYSFKLS